DRTPWSGLGYATPRRGTRPHGYRNETAGATAAAPLGPPTGSRPPHSARPATRNARGPGRAPARHRSPREPPAARARGAPHAAQWLPLSRPVLMAARRVLHWGWLPQCV